MAEGTGRDILTAERGQKGVQTHLENQVTPGTHDLHEGSNRPS